MGILELVAVILLIAWLTGTLVFPVGTSLIHVLLVVVVVIVILRLLKGERIL